MPPPPPTKGNYGGAAVGSASDDNFDCVVVMTDPHNWFEALQVLLVTVHISWRERPFQ